MSNALTYSYLEMEVCIHMGSKMISGNLVVLLLIYLVMFFVYHKISSVFSDFDVWCDEDESDGSDPKYVRDSAIFAFENEEINDTEEAEELTCSEADYFRAKDTYSPSSNDEEEEEEKKEYSAKNITCTKC